MDYTPWGWTHLRTFSVARVAVGQVIGQAPAGVEPQLQPHGGLELRGAEQPFRVAQRSVLGMAGAFTLAPADSEPSAYPLE